MKKIVGLILTIFMTCPMIVSGGIINSPGIINNVIPEKGALYNTTPLEGVIADAYTFTYTFGLSYLNSTYKNNLNTSRLEIYDPTSTQKQNAWIQVHETGIRDKDLLIFKVNLGKIIKNPYLGKLKYRLNDTNMSLPSGKKGKIASGSSGPEIYLNYRNENAQKKGKDRYDYSVEVRSLINGVSISIWTKDLDGHWQKTDTPRQYVSSNVAWKKLVWEDLPYYYNIEFVAENPDLDRSYIQDLSTASKKFGVSKED